MLKGKQIILIGWEFPGYNTEEGKALSKRIGSLAEGFGKSNNVIVLTRNHFDSQLVKIDGPRKIFLIPGPSQNPTISIPLIRQIWVFICVLLLGDQSSLWGVKAALFARKNIPINSDTIVISCFTPRGPIFAGFLLKRLNNVRWIVDLQDDLKHGLSERLFFAANFWMRNVLRSASKIIHVSPEWAEVDGQQIHRKIVTVRHSLPNVSRIQRKERIEGSGLRLIYYGGLSAHQIHPFFFNYISKSSTIKFLYAGHESTDQLLKSFNMGDHYEYAGWLDSNDLWKMLSEIDFVLIFGYTTTRQVVPSKLYELIALGMPVIIVGEDSGGIKIFEEEFKYRFPWARDEESLNAILQHPENYNFNYEAFESLSHDNFITRYHQLLEE